jgi:hypothetical protein
VGRREERRETERLLKGSPGVEDKEGIGSGRSVMEDEGTRAGREREKERSFC